MRPQGGGLKKSKFAKLNDLFMVREGDIRVKWKNKSNVIHASLVSMRKIEISFP